MQRAAGGAISATGAILGAIHLVHAVEELSEAFAAVLSGVMIPLLLSALVAGSGIWIAMQAWTAASPVRFVGWCGGSLVLGVALSVLLMQYQAAEGVFLSDQFFVHSIFATYGVSIGLLLGWYDVQRERQHAQQVEKTERLEEFASIVSHDLRNPLNVATGRLSMAREDCESEYLEDVETAHSRMQILIDDLLTLARAGDSPTDREPVDLAETTRACWANVDTSAATLRAETELTVRADRGRLQQLLENLFRNAVEHGGEAVTVTVGALPDRRGFYVEDTGPGIPEEARDRLFEMGYSTTEDGTGVGLSIVSSVVDAHGWEIAVAEGTDGGARFEIAAVEVAQ